jgi:uncharacterized protein (TIGR03437 family)
MISRNFYFGLLLSGVFAAHAGAQCSAAPSTYSDTCSELQGYLTSFQSTLSSDWNGVKSPAAFSAELTSADCNQGPAVLTSPYTLNAVETQLDGFQAVGVESVTFCMGFPILYQPFYAFNGDPQDMATILSFYQQVVANAHQHGMRVVIESSVLFPNLSSGFNLAAYYQTLDPVPGSSDLITGRAVVAQMVATEVQPDWLNLGSEPDTQSALLQTDSSGSIVIYTPQQYADEIAAIVTTLRAAGVNGTPLLGAGVGTWSPNAADFVGAEAAASVGLDYIDFHIYSVNLGFLADAATYIDMATMAGKPSAISEAWMKKVSDEQLQGKSDLGIEEQFSNNTTGCIDTFSFWAPLDAQFVSELTGLANWKNLYYISPFPTEFFYSYVPYSSSYDCSQSPATALNAETQLTVAALNTNPTPLTVTGQAYSTVIFATPTMVSAPSGASLVAPESIVSIYGVNLAAATQAATSQPLLTSLDNVTVNITDSAGTQAALPLFFVSAGQINAQIPPGLQTGLAQLSITGGPGGTLTSSVNLATVAPGIFTANQNGQGVPAAQVANNLSDGTQTITNVFNSGCTPGNCTPVPIDVSTGNSALVLYGSGIRNRASFSAVTVQIGSQIIAATYAGPTSGYTGLDQVDVPLPASLAGSGTVNVTVSVAGALSNTVTVAFQ